MATASLSARSKVLRISGMPSRMRRYTGFFLFSTQRARWASAVSLAWLRITGTNRVVKPIMVAIRFPGIKAKGFKIHSTAALISKDRVLNIKANPSNTMIVSRQQINTPDKIPCRVIEKNLISIMASPGVVTIRAPRINNSKIRKNCSPFKPDFSGSRELIISTVNRQVKMPSLGKSPLKLMRLIKMRNKSLNRTSSLCSSDVPDRKLKEVNSAMSEPPSPEGRHRVL